MNQKQVLVLVLAVVAAALILWHDLPIEFPGVVFKALLLFVKICVVAAVAVFAYFFMGRKKQTS